MQLTGGEGGSRQWGSPFGEPVPRSRRQASPPAADLGVLRTTEETSAQPMSAAIIIVRHGPGSTSFEFATSTGAAPQVSNVLVVDHPYTDELWEVRALTWTDVRAREKAQLQERLGAARLTVPEGMDPLTDFIAGDPRYQIAKEIMHEGFEAASIELRYLAYGVVPAGFEQTMPPGGTAVRLEPGRTYEVVLMGRDSGSVLFAAA
jgi:hypothetical protein